MTHDEFDQIMITMHWSNRILAKILEIDNRLVRRFRSGSRPIPAKLADWMSRMQTAVASLPDRGDYT